MTGINTAIITAIRVHYPVHVTKNDRPFIIVIITKLKNMKKKHFAHS